MIGQTLHTRQSHTTMGYAAAAVWLVLGLLPSGSAMGIPLSILTFVMTMISASRPLVTVHDDHLEIRGAPLASVSLVRFTDIAAIHPDAKKPTLQLRSGSTVKLPGSRLDEHEGAAFLTWLQSHVGGLASA
ncbi:MAG: hypothetical protein AAF721_40620 [Myxococcota bacterium]